MNRIYVRQPGAYTKFYRPQLPVTEYLVNGVTRRFSKHADIADKVVGIIRENAEIRMFLYDVGADEEKLWVTITVDGFGQWKSIDSAVVSAFIQVFLRAGDSDPEIVPDGTTIFG